MNFIILGSLFVLPLVSCDLSCYDCIPTDDDKCLEPVASNGKTTNCREDYEKSGGENEPNIEFGCFILNIVQAYSYTPQGVFRGCTNKKPEEDACNKLKSKYQHVGSCEYCTENTCNGKKLQQNDGSVVASDDNNSDNSADSFNGKKLQQNDGSVVASDDNNSDNSADYRFITFIVLIINLLFCVVM